MVSGSKQVDDLCCDANIAQDKMKSFNKREICVREQCFIFFEESVTNQYRLQQQRECI